MSLTITDFFKKGHFWTKLEATILSIKKKLKLHSKYIDQLEKNQIRTMEKIERLYSDNDHMQNRIHYLEEKIWDLTSMINNRQSNLIEYTDKKEQPSLENKLSKPNK